MAKFDNYEKPPWVSTGPRTRMLRNKKKVRQQKIAQKRKEMGADSFEAPRKTVSASKRKKNTEISKIISDIMHNWEKTGMIGKNRPPTRKAAQKMAIAVAYSIHSKKAEEFNAPYTGSGALSDIGLSTDQLTSTWGSGDFDKSSLNSSGHMTVFANAEDEEEEPEYPCDVCGKPAKYNFQDTTVRYEIVDDDFENPMVSEYGGQNQNDFYCEAHAKQYEGSDFLALRAEISDAPTFTPEGGYKCDGCGKTIDEGVNLQDIDVHWYIEDGDFTGNYELKNHLGNYNDFYCYTCAENEGFMSEGNTPVMPPMEFGEMANWRPLDGTPGLKRNRAENYKHECITCAEGMDELVAKGQTWSCECCGFLVGTQGKHEGCGYNDNGEVMCNLCATEQCDCASYSVEMVECGNCADRFSIDEGLDIGGIDYCEECYDTLMSKEVMEAETEVLGNCKDCGTDIFDDGEDELWCDECSYRLCHGCNRRCEGCSRRVCDEHRCSDECCDGAYCEECHKEEVYNAPLGFNEMGPRPFYGNPRKIAIDRWGNRRFIRRRKDGTYMKNVDVGRSIAMDRRRQSQTWAPPGFRDQGDGSPSLLERFRNRLRQ